MLVFIKNFYNKYFEKKMCLFISLGIILVLYAVLSTWLKTPFLSSSPWDSYTLQAKTWISGNIALDMNYEHLELAQYKGKFYTSFPVVPTFPALFLFIFFGDDVPSNLIVKVYTIFSYIVAYMLFRNRYALSDLKAVFWGAFVVFGSNMVFMSMNGGVWFQAQTLSFLFTILSVYFITGKSSKDIHMGLIFFALAIGCRTTQILFAPIITYFYIIHISKDSDTIIIAIRKYAYMLIIPGSIMLGYAVYNFVRFDSFTEFGYAYRPEFMSVNQIMFSKEYFARNFENFLRLPEIRFNPFRIDVPTSEGFAFYLANPILITYFFRIVLSFFKKQKIKLDDIVGFSCVLLYIFTVLIFKGLGGWQFGQRYFVDLIPFLLIFIMKNPKIYKLDIILASFAIFFNIYGSLYLFLEWDRVG